jgi:biopolymer transport protein ExbD
MAYISRGRELDTEPLNLTPLLDCILNLIFFFLLATQIKDEKTPTIEIQVPKSGIQAKAQMEKERIRVTISEQGALFYDNDAVTSAQLRSRLEESAKSNPDPLPVQIVGDRRSNLQAFVDVVEMCLDTGHSNYQLILDKRKEP